MASFKDDLDENMQKTHEYLREELDLESFTELEILLKEYWKWLQKEKQAQAEQAVDDTPEIDNEDYFG